MDYVTTKWLHIISATLLYGTGFGSAFYMFFVNRSRNVQAIAIVTKWVVRADWWFTTPTVIIQPMSGLWLIHLAGYDWQWHWLKWSMMLYAVAGLCWLPVVWLQLRMRDMAQASVQSNSELPETYWCYERWWTMLGIPAFTALLVVYWLMVAKPI